MNFENKILSLFDHGRRSAVYVAGYQSARAQAASIAAEADRLIAEMAVENAELRERLSSLENLYRVRDKDCAAKDAELERVRTIAEKAVVMLRMSGYRPIQGSNNPLESWLFDSLAILNSASPAAEPDNQPECGCCGQTEECDADCDTRNTGITGLEKCVNGGTCGAGGFCDECPFGPDTRLLDIEDQLKEGE